MRKEQDEKAALPAKSSWDQAIDQLREWDPEWAETCLKMISSPWTAGILPRKTVELISVSLSAASTALNPEATRRHIRAALAAGATRDEILMVVKMASMMSIHSCVLGGSILLEELPPSDLGADRPHDATPASDKLRAAGRWNPTWDTFFYLDPVWTDELVAAGVGIDASGAMPRKLVELLSVAFHASPSRLNAAGTRRHIQAAMRAGASAGEIIEVLKLCVVHGVQACNLVVPILAEEVAMHAKSADPTRE
jgi:alkylhydroperoxidase/carboxymuconolactone decarboxylase family protein YurZ